MLLAGNTAWVYLTFWNGFQDADITVSGDDRHLQPHGRTSGTLAPAGHPLPAVVKLLITFNGLLLPNLSWQPARLTGRLSWLAPISSLLANWSSLQAAFSKEKGANNFTHLHI